MSRECNCSGRCCGNSNEINRREFFSTVSTAAAAASLLGGTAWANWLQKAMPPEELDRWMKSLREPAAPRVYKSGVHADARMHLGGIGTGNIEIGCDGQLTNWQLFNTLRDGQVPFAFVIKDGETARLLQTAGGPDWPRVERIEMTGEYPIAELKYFDKALKVDVQLTAFTPFAPLDAEFSSMPLAVFIFRLHNPTDQPRKVSLAALMQNPVGYDADGEIKGNEHPKFGGNINQSMSAGLAAGLWMYAQPDKAKTTDGNDPTKAPGFGSLALAAVAESVTLLPTFEDWNDAWKKFQAGELLPFDKAKTTEPTPQGRTINGAVAATVEVPANGNIEVPFILTWHYPNKYSPDEAKKNFGIEKQWIGCHYAEQCPDANAVITKAADNLSELRRRTELFRKTFYQSTLPYWMLDCITSQAATIRHVGVVFRIANGEVYGWEGSNGCCQPTCTHVWGYEQSLARLFPELAKIMARINFKNQQNPDGGINTRTAVPAQPQPTGQFPFVDGQAGCILRAYREAMNHPDDSFLKEYWPLVRKAVDYLVNRDAAGNEPDGVLEDDQWNTYDQDLHGATTFISGYYLAALRAGEEWARRMGDAETADQWHALFLKGQENLVKRCFNGEYFQQDLPDYENRGRKIWGETEVGEVGPGCMADQLIGQWWAHQLGLGYILPKDKVQSALKAIFKYNWVPDLTGFKHAPRAFAGDKDKGLLIVTWPKGGRPKTVMLYSDEVWTGIEYQVAAHMIYEGMIDEGLAIVRGARDRYDGVPRPPIGRNPWNEIECGGHYARAMSSWSLLLAASGYEYDGPAKRLRFTPRMTPENFQSFFCGPEGWGSLRQTRQGATQRNEIRVAEGVMKVAQLRLCPPEGVMQVALTLDGKPLSATLKLDGSEATVSLSEATINAGETLSAEFS
jgi:uncharacterized protein (DUF608 family)